MTDGLERRPSVPDLDRVADALLTDLAGAAEPGVDRLLADLGLGAPEPAAEAQLTQLGDTPTEHGMDAQGEMDALGTLAELNENDLVALAILLARRLLRGGSADG